MQTFVNPGSVEAMRKEKRGKLSWTSGGAQPSEEKRGKKKEGVPFSSLIR